MNRSKKDRFLETEKKWAQWKGIDRFHFAEDLFLIKALVVNRAVMID